MFVWRDDGRNVAVDVPELPGEAFIGMRSRRMMEVMRVFVKGLRLWSL